MALDIEDITPPASPAAKRASGELPAVRPPKPPRPAPLIPTTHTRPVPEVLRIPKEASGTVEGHPLFGSDQECEEDELSVSRIEIPSELLAAHNPDSLPPNATQSETVLSWLKWNARTTAATASSLGRFVKQQDKLHKSLDSAVSDLRAAFIGAVAKGAKTVAGGLTLGGVVLLLVSAIINKGCDVVGEHVKQKAALTVPAQVAASAHK
jgi:hypothetical protein